MRIRRCWANTQRKEAYMIIAVDFDGTLCEHKYPDIGHPKWDIIDFIKERQARGDKIILWTCRDGEFLEKAVKWCEEHDIRLDAINDDLLEVKEEQFGKEKSCKVYANLYIDDKAINSENKPLLRIMRAI